MPQYCFKFFGPHKKCSMLQRINLNYLAMLLNNVMRRISGMRYDGYLAISVFKLLSSVVEVDVWLGEVGEVFLVEGGRF